MPVKKLGYFKFSFIFSIILLLQVNVTAQEPPLPPPDITAPSITLVQTPSSPDGDNGWYVTPVKFDMYASDLESGVASINYRIDQGSWQSVTFTNTENLAENPSFELPDITTSGLASWEASVIDIDGTYSQDVTTSFSGYEVSSAKIEATGGLWHGINNSLYYVETSPYDNMNASVWLKTQNITGTAYFTVYAVSLDEFSQPVYTQLAQSSTLTGTNDWTNLSLDFSVGVVNAVGVYIDIGLSGPGTLWIDALNLSSSYKNTFATVSIGSDNEDHTFEYYAVDNAGNIEAHSCVSPKINCVEFKLDGTPPSNWRNSGAIRGFFGSSHELWVYAQVDDYMSGLKVFSDKYQYHTEREPTFGRYSNILSCNGSWWDNVWTILITPPFSSGSNTALLITPKTDFCNSNWKQCKTVKFYVEDMAGNIATKDFCINGPWIAVEGGGAVKANQNISMVAEADDQNTDGLIEARGNIVDFFTSSKDWIAKESTADNSLTYQQLKDLTNSKSSMTDISGDSGIYEYEGDFTLDNSALPGGFKNYQNRKILVFIDGNLTIDTKIETHNTSALMFVVSGNVGIKKSVDEVRAAIIADGEFDTAYNVEEGDSTNTLDLYGIFVANNFLLKRTLQGTNNAHVPSESFYYEPKYLIELKDYFDNNTVVWDQF